jgi:hypothetical protein
MTQTTEKMMWSGWKEDEELAETVTRSGHGLVRGGNEARRGRELATVFDFPPHAPLFSKWK